MAAYDQQYFRCCQYCHHDAYDRKSSSGHSSGPSSTLSTYALLSLHQGRSSLLDTAWFSRSPGHESTGAAALPARKFIVFPYITRTMLGRKFLRTAPSTPVPPYPAPGPVRVSHTDFNKYFRMLKTLLSDGTGTTPIKFVVFFYTVILAEVV